MPCMSRGAAAIMSARVQGRTGEAIVSNFGSARALPDVASVLTAENLHGLFQPIVDVAKCAVFGHEGLIRGVRDTPDYLPAALFREANAEGVSNELEFIAAEVILAGYRQERGGNLLFMNFSARGHTQDGVRRRP